MSAVPHFIIKPEPMLEKIDAAIAVDTWPTLDPLPELTIDPPAEFPTVALGPILGPAVEAIADTVQVPAALAAGSVLSAAALAVQPHADVMLPHGQAVPTSLFVVTRAGSGERKSAADAVASIPIEERRREDGRKHVEALQRWRDEQAGRPRSERDEKPPAARVVIVGRCTTEGLQRLLSGQSSLGLFSPEGAEVIGGHSMREDRKSAALAWLLKAWSGETLDSMTAGDGLSLLFGRRLTMHILLQPVVADALLSDPLAVGQGWLARCLMAAPASLAGTRMFREDAPAPSSHPAVSAFHERIAALLEREPITDPAGDGLELRPQVLSFTREARAVWIAFYDEIERLQAEGLELAGVRPWASKAAEHAARIAAVVHMVSAAQGSSIDAETMAGACEVASFYLHEHVRMSGQSAAGARLKRLHLLLDWMVREGHAVKQARVLQFAPHPVRRLKAAGLQPLLDELAQRGYIRRKGDTWEVRPC